MVWLLHLIDWAPHHGAQGEGEEVLHNSDPNGAAACLAAKLKQPHPLLHQAVEADSPKSGSHGELNLNSLDGMEGLH